MKKIWITIGLTCLIAFALMPKEKEIIYEHRIAEDINIIKVDIKGPFPYEGTYHFFEPVTVQKVLSYAGKPFSPIDDYHVIYSEMITRDKTLHMFAKDDEVNEIKQLVNINLANFKELIEIPYMTETRAASLIIYRELNGPFMSIDDLIHVKHIGVVTLENIRPYITLS